MSMNFHAVANKSDFADTADREGTFEPLTQKLLLSVLQIRRGTVKILCIGTDRSHQTVQTKIRLLLKKQSDQGLRCLPFNQHLLDALMQCYS